MDNQFVLRRGDITDVNALSQFYQKCFREAFVESLSIPYPEKDLVSFFHTYGSSESFAKKLNHPKRAIWIIEDKTNGEFVAYAMAGPCDVNIPHPDVCSNEDGLINRLYVRRDRQSHGFGQQLMNVALLWLEEHCPSRPIWLIVGSPNVKAQKFYTHYGFSIVGSSDFFVGEWKDDVFIMKRQTDAS